MEFSVPTELDSERLQLRQFVESDWKQMHRYYSDSEATRFTVGRPLTEGETWRTVSSMVGHWMLRGFGPYAVTRKEDQQLLGVVGFWYPGDWPEPEIKWGLIQDYWGQGYASEAARCVLKAAHEHMSETPWISFIDRRNHASIRLAQSVGAQFESEQAFRGGVFHVYRHKRWSDS